MPLRTAAVADASIGTRPAVSGELRPRGGGPAGATACLITGLNCPVVSCVFEQPDPRFRRMEPQVKKQPEDRPCPEGRSRFHGFDRVPSEGSFVDFSPTRTCSNLSNQRGTRYRFANSRAIPQNPSQTEQRMLPVVGCRFRLRQREIADTIAVDRRP